MQLTPPLLEQLRLTILRILDENCSERFGLNEFAVRHLLAAQGFKLTIEEVARECDYLADPTKGMIEPVGKKISPSVRAWRITAAGRDYGEEIRG